MTQSMSSTNKKNTGRARRVMGAGFGLATAAAILATGCLERPVARISPIQQSVYVEPLVNAAVDKIDILFVIDNSGSMADKQVVLKQALPRLLNRLVAPWCEDDAGSLVPSSAGACPEGTAPEFNAIGDMHIAVITSSLGVQGGNGAFCDRRQDAHESNNDHAYLLPLARSTAIPGAEGITDFLRWGPKPDLAQVDTTVGQFQSLVAGAGENGCGFEATMEAWYRFLIQPDPGTGHERVSCGNGDEEKKNCVAETGDDTERLRQRAEFLRNDSLVAVIQLSDENDCSVNTNTSLGHWATSTEILPNSNGDKARMPTASAICADNPNDKCCRSCATTRSAECPAEEACDSWGRLNVANDQVNLRCWDHKRRFGMEFLYPVSRYVNGLTALEVPGRDGAMHKNPLYFSGDDPNLAGRGLELVFLAGIVGVPWQDLTEDPAAEGLKYLSAEELTKKGRWADILGEPKGASAGGKPVPPGDAFMVESVLERTGENPITGDKLPGGNNINGNDRPIVDGADLQYACTFELETPRVCTTDSNCDCATPDKFTNNPLCNETTQVGAKAYPGTRFLEVLKGFSDTMYERTAGGAGQSNAIVASICPKSYKGADLNSDSYGYTPAVTAIIDRLKEALNGSCLPRPLEVDETDNTVPCNVVESYPSGGGACDCNVPGRGEVPPETLAAVQRELDDLGICGPGSGQSCSADRCYCTVKEQTAPDSACMTEPSDTVIKAGSPDAFGWCYIQKGVHTDPAQETVLEEIGCDGVNPQVLRIVGDRVAGAVTLVACQLKSEQ